MADTGNKDRLDAGIVDADDQYLDADPNGEQPGDVVEPDAPEGAYCYRYDLNKPPHERSQEIQKLLDQIDEAGYAQDIAAIAEEIRTALTGECEQIYSFASEKCDTVSPETMSQLRLDPTTGAAMLYLGDGTHVMYEGRMIFDAKRDDCGEFPQGDVSLSGIVIDPVESQAGNSAMVLVEVKDVGGNPIAKLEVRKGSFKLLNGEEEIGYINEGVPVYLDLTHGRITDYLPSTEEIASCSVPDNFGHKGGVEGIHSMSGFILILLALMVRRMGTRKKYERVLGKGD